MTILKQFPLVGLILLACGQAVLGGNYTDPSGFSFAYPEGWVPVTSASMGDFKQALPPELKDWVSRNNMDLSRVSVLLLRNGHEEFLENVNVVVQQQQIPVDDNTVKQFTRGLPQQYQAMGVQVENVQGRVQKVGGRDAVVVEYQSRMPAVPGTLRQRQVMFPGGGKTYIVTCTAQVDAFDKYEPVFDGVLASFMAPAPLAQGFNWSRVGTMAVVGGIVGGLIGALSWLAKRFASKSPS